MRVILKSASSNLQLCMNLSILDLEIYQSFVQRFGIPAGGHDMIGQHPFTAYPFLPDIFTNPRQVSTVRFPCSIDRSSIVSGFDMRRHDAMKRKHRDDDFVLTISDDEGDGVLDLDAEVLAASGEDASAGLDL